MASLISEVSTHVSINHTIKYAEQVFYGQKSIYSTPNLNQASTSSADVSGKHESEEVATLRKQVSQLTLEKEQLTKEVSDLRAQLQKSASVSQPAAAAPAADADEDFDLFGSDDEEESEEQQRIREERLSAYAAKKARKPGPIAKSSVIIDVKPWDDETDLKKMEECVRSIIKDGLNWGASKTIPVGYGINKLQIVSTIEDEKISVDNDIVEFIQEEFADYVQSVDIVAFNKI